MTQIGELAFSKVSQSGMNSTIKEDDENLYKRMKCLSFLTPNALDIRPELFNETLLSIAANELKKINAFITPGEKIECVVSSCHSISPVLSFYPCLPILLTSGEMCDNHLPIAQFSKNQTRS
jgi:hypothetical protein